LHEENAFTIVMRHSTGYRFLGGMAVSAVVRYGYGFVQGAAMPFSVLLYAALALNFSQTLLLPANKL